MAENYPKVKIETVVSSSPHTKASDMMDDFKKRKASLKRMSLVLKSQKVL